MRYRWTLLSLLAAIAVIAMPHSGALAGGVGAPPKAILDALGLRTDQPFGTSVTPGTVIKATVLDPAKLTSRGFSGVRVGDTAIITVAADGRFTLELPQRRAFGVDATGKIVP